MGRRVADGAGLDAGGAVKDIATVAGHHTVTEIDAEVRELLIEISRRSASTATAKRPPTRTLIQTYRAPIPDR